MTNREKFTEVVKRNNGKIYEVAFKMEMSPQTLYNKMNNSSDFTAPEMAMFRKLFPDVTDDEFNEIFFADELTAEVNG